MFRISLISVLSLTFTLWTGTVLHSTCPSPRATLIQSTCIPLPPACLSPIFHRFRFSVWTRTAWGSPDVLLCLLFYVLDALVLLPAQSASLLQQWPAFKVCQVPQQHACNWCCVDEFNLCSVCLFIIPHVFCVSSPHECMLQYQPRPTTREVGPLWMCAFFTVNSKLCLLNRKLHMWCTRKTICRWMGMTDMKATVWI